MNYKLGFVFAGLLLAVLTGCGEMLVRAEPDTFAVEPSAAAHLRKQQTIVLKNAYQTETKVRLMRMTADLKQWTDTAIVMLSRAMAKQDITVAPQADKSVALRVHRVQVGVYGIVAAPRYRATLVLEAEYGDGTKTSIEALNTAPFSVQRAIDGAMLFALNDLLRHEQFVAYMNVIADPQARIAVLAAESSRSQPPQTPAQVPVQAALAARTHAADARPADALPMAGASWQYAYTMRGVGSARYTIGVRVTGVEGSIVRESISIPSFPQRLVAVDMDSLSFRSIQLPQSQTLVELAPYLHSVLAKNETRIWGNLPGYPAGNPVLPPWTITVRESGLEEVTVPAGTFKATRIEVSGRRKMSGSIPFHLNYESSRFRFRAWYAPEVRRYVKLQHETWSLGGPPSGEQLVELTSYTAK